MSVLFPFLSSCQSPMQTLLDLRTPSSNAVALCAESRVHREIFRQITSVPIPPSTAVSSIPRVRPFLSGAQVVFLWIHLHPLELIQKAADVPNFSFTPLCAETHPTPQTAYLRRQCFRRAVESSPLQH